jgi:hypothetical protein
MAHEQKHLRKKDSLHMEEIISDLISDNLSDVPADTFSASDSERESESDTKKKNVASERQWESGSEGSDDSASTSNAGATTWVKINKAPILGQFTGNPGGNKFSWTLLKCPM